MIHSKEEEGSESVGLLLRVMLVRGELQAFTPLSGSSPSLFLPHQIAMRILLRFNQWGDFYTGLWGKCVDIWKTQMGKGVPEGKDRTSRSVAAQAWRVGNMATPMGLLENWVRSDDDKLWTWTFSAFVPCLPTFSYSCACSDLFSPVYNEDCTSSLYQPGHLKLATITLSNSGLFNTIKVYFLLLQSLKQSLGAQGGVS